MVYLTSVANTVRTSTYQENRYCNLGHQGWQQNRHLSDMVGEYVWVKKDVVVVGDARSLLPSVGRARRTWSDLQQVKLEPVFL